MEHAAHFRNDYYAVFSENLLTTLLHLPSTKDERVLENTCHFCKTFQQDTVIVNYLLA